MERRPTLEEVSKLVKRMEIGATVMFKSRIIEYYVIDKYRTLCFRREVMSNGYSYRIVGSLPGFGRINFQGKWVEEIFNFVDGKHWEKTRYSVQEKKNCRTIL